MVHGLPGEPGAAKKIPYFELATDLTKVREQKAELLAILEEVDARGPTHDYYCVGLIGKNVQEECDCFVNRLAALIPKVGGTRRHWRDYVVRSEPGE